MFAKLEPFGAWRIEILTVLWFVCAAGLFAQSNEAVDRLLEEKPATFGDAAYVIISAAGLIPEDSTPEAAAAFVVEERLLKNPYPFDAPATLGQVCFLLMRTQGIRGGILYSLFPGPHYAARELAYLGLLKGNTHPSRAVSGEEVMWVVGAVLHWREEK